PRRALHSHVLAFLALDAALLLATNPLPPGRRTFVFAVLVLPYAPLALLEIARPMVALARPAALRRAPAFAAAVALLLAAGGALTGLDAIRGQNANPDYRDWRRAALWLAASPERPKLVLAESEEAGRYATIFGGFAPSEVLPLSAAADPDACAA